MTITTDLPIELAPSITSVPKRKPGKTRKESTVVIGLATLSLLLGLWFAASYFEWASPLFLPSPMEVAAQFQTVARDGYAEGTLFDHLVSSLWRIGTALAIALAIGIPVGLTMGLNRWVRGVFSVPIDIYWGLPPLAYLPLLIIWLGIGEVSKVTLLTLSAFAPICFSAQAGVRSVPAEHVNAALSLGGNRRQIFTSIILPSALPEILTGIRIAIGVSLATLVAAELIAARSGLGYMIMSAANFLATDVVFVGLIVIAALAFSLSAGMRWLERRLVPWKGKL